MIKEDIKNIDEMIAAFDIKAATKPNTYYSFDAVFDILEKFKLMGYNYSTGCTGYTYWCSIFNQEDRNKKTPSAYYDSEDSLLDAIFLTIGFFLAKKNREMEILK